MNINEVNNKDAIIQLTQRSSYLASLKLNAQTLSQKEMINPAL